MSVEQQVEAYIRSQPAAKAAELQALHRLITGIAPVARLWFLDGRDGGKVVSNPNIGYGIQTIAYANGTSRDFYRVGLSANTAGISVYVMGLDDKTYLARTWGAALGKASVTGYCIKFRRLADIDLAVLADVLRFGLTRRQSAA